MSRLFCGLGLRALGEPILLACLAGALAPGLLGCSIPEESHWPSLVIMATPETGPCLGRCNLEEFKRMDGTGIRVVTLPVAQLVARFEEGGKADLVVVSDPALMESLMKKGLVEGEPWRFEFVRNGIEAVDGDTVLNSRTAQEPPGRHSARPQNITRPRSVVRMQSLTDPPEHISGAVFRRSGNPVAARRLWGFLEKSLRQPAQGYLPASHGETPDGATGLTLDSRHDPAE